MHYLKSQFLIEYYRPRTLELLAKGYRAIVSKAESQPAVFKFSRNRNDRFGLNAEIPQDGNSYH